MIFILILFSLTDTEKFAFAKGLYQDGMYELAEKELNAFLSEFPHSKYGGKAAYLYISTLFQQNKFKSVVNSADNLMKKYPEQSRNILIIRGRVWLNQSAWASALSDFKKVGGNKGRYWKAETYLRMKKYKKAISLYKGVKGNLRDYAMFSIAWCYTRMKNYQKAITYLDKFIQSFRKSPLIDDAKFYKAENLYLSGNPESAVKICKRYIKEYPKGKYRGRVYLLLADIYAKEGNITEQRDALKNIITENLSEKNYALYKLGLSYFDGQDFPSADSIFSLIPSKSQFGNDGVYWKALCLKKENKEDDAVKLFQHLVEAGGNLGNQSAYQIGLIYYKKGKFNKALDYLSIINNGLKDAAYILIGNIMMKQGKNDKAAEYYSNAYELKGENASLAVYRSAILKYKTGQYDSALVYLNKYKTEFPNGKRIGNIYLLMGDIYFKKKEYDNSIKYYKMAESGGTNIVPYALQGIGWAYIGMGKYNNSFKILDSLISLYPEFEGKGEVFLEMGDAAYSIKDYKHAEEAYKKVSGEYKQEGLYRLGNLYFTTANYDTAYQIFTKIIKDYPVYSNVYKCWYMAGLCLRKMKDFEGSNNTLKKLISLSPPTGLKYNAYLTIGENLYNNQKYKEALKTYKEALKLFTAPDTAEFPAIKGRLRSAYMLGDVAGLRKEIKDITGKYKDTPIEKDICLIVGDMLYNVGIYADALKYYKKVDTPQSTYYEAMTLLKLGKKTQAENTLLNVSNYPEYRSKALLLLGKTLIQDGNYSEAKRYLKNSGTPEAMAYYAQCLEKEGKTEEAKSVLSNLMGKTNGVAELSLGKILKGEGKLDEALNILQKITDQPEVGDEAYLEMGRIYKKRKNYQEAIMNYLKVKYLYPNSRFISQALFEAGETAKLSGDKGQAIKFYKEVIERNDNNELVKKARRSLSLIK